MSNKWVVNASPLILLAKVEHIHLLQKLTEQLVIPANVATEVQGGPPGDPARVWLNGEGAAWIRREIETVPSVAAWDLGAGETAVLSWAHKNKEFEAIIDDRAARKCAVIEQIAVRGTLGVIFAAKVRGLIPRAQPLCEAIVRAGLRLHPRLLREALKLVGE